MRWGTSCTSPTRSNGTLTKISATGGIHVHLHYDHPLRRLTDIKRVVNNQSVETLTHYRYDEHG